MRVALALVSAVVLSSVLPLSDAAAAVSDPYAGTWNVARAAGTPWASGGTLTITRSESATVGPTGQDQFDTYARGYCTGPPPPGGTQPSVSAWYTVTHSWSGGGTMGGCVSDKTNGQLIFFGPGTMGAARGVDGRTIGGHWTNNPNGQQDYTATIAGDAPAGGGGGGGGGTGCAASVWSACNLPFGRLSTLPVPAPGAPADVSSARLPANADTVEADVAVSDAEIDQFLATLALVKRRVAERELREQVGACFTFAVVSTDASVDYTNPLNVPRSGAIHLACLEFLRRNANAAPGATRAAARRCRVSVVPVWRRGARPSVRQQRKAAAVYRRLAKASCRSSAPGRLALRVAARGKRTTLNRVLGRRAQTGVVRSAPAGAQDGPNAKLTVRWRRR